MRSLAKEGSEVRVKARISDFDPDRPDILVFGSKKNYLHHGGLLTSPYVIMSVNFTMKHIYANPLI